MKRLILIALFVSVTAVAQSPRFAISTHATSFNIRDRIVGVGATFGYTLAHRFALESTVNFFPGNPRNDLGHPGLYPILGAWRSGNIIQGQFGIKAAVVQTKKADFFVTIKPGIVSFSRLMYRVPALNTILGDQFADAGRQTYFAPFFGAGAQVYPTTRTFFRLDVGATVIRYSGFTTTLSATNFPMVGAPVLAPPASTTHTLQFSTGFGFRFGGTR